MHKAVPERKLYEPGACITRSFAYCRNPAGDTLKNQTISIRDIALIKEKALYYFRNANFNFKTEPDLNLAECYARATLEYLQKHYEVNAGIKLTTEPAYGGSEME